MLLGYCISKEKLWCRECSTLGNRLHVGRGFPSANEAWTLYLDGRERMSRRRWRRSVHLPLRARNICCRIPECSGLTIYGCVLSHTHISAIALCTCLASIKCVAHLIYGHGDKEFDNMFYAVGRSFATFSGSCAPDMK